MLLKEIRKAAPDKSIFFLTLVKFLGHLIEGNRITLSKFRLYAIIKLQPPSNKKKIQEFLGMLNFLSNYVYKMQLYLKPIYNVFRKQNKFECTTEHQKRFEVIKTLLTEQVSNTISDPDQPFYAMCDASNFGIGAALLKSHIGTKKLILFQQTQNFLHKLNLDSLHL